jgi:hypothetical protein
LTCDVVDSAREAADSAREAVNSARDVTIPARDATTKARDAADSATEVTNAARNKPINHNKKSLVLMTWKLPPELGKVTCTSSSPHLLGRGHSHGDRVRDDGNGQGLCGRGLHPLPPHSLKGEVKDESHHSSQE